MEQTADTDSAAAPALDSSRYPRTYRVSARYRALLLLLGLVVLIAGLAGVWYFATGHETGSVAEALGLTALCFGFALLGGALVLYALTSKIVLRADAIEQHDFLGVRRLRRDDIAGWRLVPAQYISVLAFESRRAGVKPLRISQLFPVDEPFDDWMAGLPNLDVQEWERSAAALAADRALGRTPDERLARLAVARRRARVLTALAVIASVWGFVWPAPYALVIAALALLPLAALALVAWAGSLYQIAGHRNDARANLVVVYIGPSMTLGVRALLDIALLEWVPALLLTLVAAAALALVIVAADAKVRERRWELAAVLLFAGAYAWGAVVEANALLDRSAVIVHEVTVLDQRESHGRTTEYYLRLAPWGPRAEEHEVAVPRALYEASPPGSLVCVAQRAGALGIGWYSVQACTAVHRARG
jgi:hypothetical protein